MGKIVIDATKLDDAEKMDLLLIKELQLAAGHLGNALIIIDGTPEKTVSRLSQKAVKARHKLQILKAQIQGVLEDSLKFRQTVRRILDKEFVKASEARRTGKAA